MRILIDGDACPVIDITEKLAKKNKLELIIFSDLTHQLKSNYATVISLDKANQAVDMALFNQCQPGDIVITQDYGLASLILSKQAYPINSFGKRYHENNIDHLLMKRHLHAKMRRAGQKHATHSKRTKEDDQKFKQALKKLIKKKKRED